MAERPRIFISYRRSDTARAAARLAERLRDELGADRVFLDSDAIGGGQPWASRLREALADCTVLVALMGESWLRAQNEQTGVRRLDEPEDYVRRELEWALDARLSIIPLCVDDASLPTAAALPASIRRLLDYQSHPLRTTDNPQWNEDVRRILAALSPRAGASGREALPPSAAAVPTRPGPDDAFFDVAIQPALHGRRKQRELVTRMLPIAFAALLLVILAQPDSPPRPRDAPAQVIPASDPASSRRTDEAEEKPASTPALPALPGSSATDPPATRPSSMEPTAPCDGSSPNAACKALSGPRVASIASPSSKPPASAGPQALARLDIALTCAGSRNSCVAQRSRLVIHGLVSGEQSAEVGADCRAHFSALELGEGEVTFSLRPGARAGSYNCAVDQKGMPSTQLPSVTSLRIESCFCSGVDTDEYGFRCEQRCPSLPSGTW